MKKNDNYTEVIKSLNSYLPQKILRGISIIVSVTALIELVLAQLSIRMTRLSAVETTGIALFTFVIFGLVTMFAVSRMKDGVWRKIFAILMNFATGTAALWYLRLLFTDEMFFRNLYFVLNRQTQVYELLPLGGRIAASVPLAAIVVGTAVFFLSGLAILILSPAVYYGNEPRE